MIILYLLTKIAQRSELVNIEDYIPEWILNDLLNNIELYPSTLIFAGILIAVARMGALYSHSFLTSILSSKVLRSTKLKMSKKILYMEFTSDLDNSEKVSALQSDLDRVQLFIQTGFLSIFRDTMIIITMIIGMIIIDYRLFLVAFIALPLIIISIYTIGEIVKKKEKRIRQINSNLFLIISEALNNIYITRFHNAEELEYNKLSIACEDYYEEEKKLYKWKSIAMPFADTIGVFLFLVFMYIVISSDISDPLSLSSLITFVFAVLRTSGPIQNLSKLWLSFKQVQASIDRVNALLTMKQIHKKKKINIDPKGSIKIENLHFSYDKNKTYTLHNINIDIHENSFTIITGPNGSGKSTLSYLIGGLYTPQKGSIRIGSHLMNRMNAYSLRSFMSLVPQNITLFDGTIKENILYGYNSHNKSNQYIEKLIRESIKNTKCEDFINDLSADIETKIGENGYKLSGGQRQKLSLARALIKKPRILILDEPANHMDQLSQLKLIDTMKNLPWRCTIIAITHNPVLVNNTDNIITIEGGKII